MIINKKVIKAGISCIITIYLSIISLGYLTDLLERKASNNKYEAFFLQEEDFDVLFMGTSHVMNAVFPMELWKDYGITSYNFGGHSNELATTYWVLENALDYTTPSLVVIDCFQLSSDEKISSSFDYVHLSLDAFPLSRTKLSAVSDLLTNDTTVSEAKADEKKALSILWDYSIYHSRWTELTENDFNPAPSMEKGAEARVGICVPDKFAQIPSDKKLTVETTGISYLKKIIEDCQQRGIEVLLIYLPFPASELPQLEANYVYDVAKEYNINYINFQNMNIVNYNTDCFDSSSHLNPSGAKKITDYLGQYITENYDIVSHKTDYAYSNWFDDYEQYKSLKQFHLNTQQDLDIYLMLLADKNYNAIIEIHNPDILQDEYYVQLFDNTEKDYFFTPDDSDADICIRVTDKDTGEFVDNATFSFSFQGIIRNKTMPIVTIPHND
ncbi:MAG: hypothetical protein NC337_08215 [Roseburia sp.]|nr:hypothetical protein [Roseburia sp.]